MNKFQLWYTQYSSEITWFIIGVCLMSCIANLSLRNYGNAALDAFFVVVNYMFWSRR